MSDPTTTDEQKEALKRKIFAIPCDSQEALHRWILLFLGVDIPDCIVDPDSNSSPMGMIWEIYSKARANDPDYSRALFYAARGCFKCQAKGTLILAKDRGLVRIEDAHVGDVIWSGKSWRPITHWVHDGVKESVTVTLDSGLTNTGSPIHRVWAWRPNQEPDWVRLSDLTNEDYVCLDTSHEFGRGPIDEEEFQKGYLCGVLQGDGCLTLMDDYNAVILSTMDSVVLDAFTTACLKYAGRAPTKVKTRPYDYRINSKAMVSALKALGLTNSYSFEKTLPESVRTSSSAMAGFFSGIFDTDGTVTDQNEIVLQMTAETMLRDCQVVLAALGVNSRFRANNKIYAGQRHRVFSLVIPSNEFPSLTAAGVRCRAHKANVAEVATTPDALDSIPAAQLRSFLSECMVRGGRDKKGLSRKPRSLSYRTITRAKAKRLADWALERGLISETRHKEVHGWFSNRWSRVTGATRGTADFYDLTVDVDHSYWSAGVISHNTLSAAIIELLMVFHLNRNVAHMAAVEGQSHISLGYVRGFFSKLPFRDFVEGDAKGSTVVLRYVNRNDGTVLAKGEYDLLSEVEKIPFGEVRNFIKVVVCTMKGANGLHASYFCTDELDVINDVAAFQESLMIPAADRPGVNPISMLTSSRKFSFGLVQKEIDTEFDKEGDRRVHIRHWNIVDVTEACPASRHRPDLPRLPIYLDEPNLVALSKEKYDKLDPDARRKFVEKEGYTGCLTNCKLFASCRGFLATKQKSTSPLLRSISFTQTQFRTVSVPTANAQLLCRKPSTEGLIYPHLERSIHMLTPAQIVEKITGETARPDMTKAELIVFLKARGVRFSAGMDFGFKHNFAVPLAAIDGARAFVIGCISAPDLLPDAMIHKCNADIKSFNPSIWPDTASPQLIAMFKKAGYRMREWDKGSGSVNNGIDIVCMRLRPTIGEPLLYFLAGDPGVEVLFKNMSQYHWTIDDAGDPTDTPDEEDDDESDGLRYLIMNEFKPTKRVVSAPANDIRKSLPTPAEEYKKHTANWFQKWKEANGVTDGGPDGQSGKKGNFKWSL